jgi:signal transduction histidine kinase
MIETVNMFKAEFASNDIQAYSECEPSFEEHKVERVFCDPSRLRQVLINLLTNVRSDILSHLWQI